jgi:hypothetical protein
MCVCLIQFPQLTAINSFYNADAVCFLWGSNQLLNIAYMNLS